MSLGFVTFCDYSIQKILEGIQRLSAMPDQKTLRGIRDFLDVEYCFLPVCLYSKRRISPHEAKDFLEYRASFFPHFPRDMGTSWGGRFRDRFNPLFALPGWFGSDFSCASG
jgi:hypothetical protein